MRGNDRSAETVAKDSHNMRLILLFAIALLVAVLGASYAVANPSYSARQFDGASSEAAVLSGVFSDRESYFLRRFAQALLTSHAPISAPARQAKAPEFWASGGRPGHVETLSLHYRIDRLSFTAGKYTPSFGVSAKLAPHSLAAGISLEYEQKGRLGFGGAWDIGGSGEHALSLNTYFLESRLLNAADWQNESAPAETKKVSDLRHVSAAFDGEIATPLDSLFYHVAARYQESDEVSASREFGYVAALHSAIEVAGGAVFGPVVEFVYLDDNGEVGLVQHFLTFGVTGELGPWNLSLTYSAWDLTPDDPAAAEQTQSLRQFLLRYRFDDGATLDFGHRSDASGSSSNGSGGGGGDALNINMSFRVTIPL
jgi:hypothetical protein